MKTSIREVETDAEAPSAFQRLAGRASKVVVEPKLGKHVVVHESAVGDILPIVGLAEKDNQVFAQKILVLSVEIDGERFTEEQLAQLGFSNYQLLTTLLPHVLEVNGLGPPVGKPKND